MIQWVVERLKEPSTWAGIGTLVGAAGIAISPELWKEIMATGMALGGLIAVIVKEKSS